MNLTPPLLLSISLFFLSLQTCFSSDVSESSSNVEIQDSNVGSIQPSAKSAPLLDENLKTLSPDVQFYMAEKETNPNLAFALYNISAATGHARSQYNLGHFFKLGRGGVRVNKPKALVYQAFSAKQNYLPALMTVGYMYWSGHIAVKSCDKAVDYYKIIAEQVISQVEETGLQPNVEIAKIQEDFETGRDRFAEESDVVEYYQYSANTGDLSAQLTMGNLHLEGSYGVEKDFEKAFNYYKMAEESGEISSLVSLGFMYQQGYYVAQDNKTAIEYYKRAVAQGFAGGYTRLGYMYLYGTGVPQSYSKALENFKLAADQRNHEAQLYMGLIYLNGWGVEKNMKSAINYLSLSAHQGNLVALYHIATMNLKALGFPQSCSNAIVYLKRIAEKSDVTKMITEAYEHFLNGRYDQALALYEKTAEMGFEKSQLNAAWMYDNSFCSEAFCPSDFDRQKRALYFYSLAASQNNVDATVRLGDYYYYGFGTDRDLEKAVSLYRIASGSNHAQALFNLAYMHQHGEGLSKDLFLAKRYYDMVYEVSPEGYLPSMIALCGLGVHFVFDYLTGNLQTTTPVFDKDILLIFIAVLLLILLILRRLMLADQMNNPEPVEQNVHDHQD